MTQPPLKKMSMKTFGIFIAIWLIGMIGVFAGSAIYNNYQGEQYSKTAIPYLQKVIPELSSWDPEQIKGLMAPETLENIPEEQFRNMVNWFSKLGKLRSSEAPVFEKIDSRLTKNGAQQKVVEYSVAATYENGDARLNVKLLDLGDSFEIYHFSFGSEILSGKQTP